MLDARFRLRNLKDLKKKPRLRKGEVFAYVGLPQNLKDLKDLKDAVLSTEGRVVGLCMLGELKP